MRLGNFSDYEMSHEVSIHAPREGCDMNDKKFAHRLLVSIHAPREGCDTGDAFQTRYDNVSIHAPREGCDGLETKVL